MLLNDTNVATNRPIWHLRIGRVAIALWGLYWKFCWSLLNKNNKIKINIRHPNHAEQLRSIIRTVAVVELRDYKCKMYPLMKAC